MKKILLLMVLAFVGCSDGSKIQVTYSEWETVNDVTFRYKYTAKCKDGICELISSEMETK